MPDKTTVAGALLGTLCLVVISHWLHDASGGAGEVDADVSPKEKDGDCDAACRARVPAPSLLLERMFASRNMDGLINVSDAHSAMAQKEHALRRVTAEMKRIMPGVSILDIGSGNGFAASLVASKVQSKVVKAYDVVSPKGNVQSITAATSSDRDKEYVPINLFDGKHIPEKDSSWDVVVCIYALHHAGHSQEALLRDMRRVSRRYVMITEDLNEPRFIERNKLHDENGFFRTRAEWLRHFESMRMRVVREAQCVEGGVGPQWFFILEKVEVGGTSSGGL